MDSIKKFFANFKKHGSISWSKKKKVEVLKNREISKEAKDIMDTSDLITVNNDECEIHEVITVNSKTFLEESENNGSPPETEAISTSIGNTRKHLKEFNEILHEKNIENTDSVTLDDVNEVLNETTEEPNVSANYETPRFDLQDLLDNFGLIFEQYDLEPTLIDDVIEPNTENNVDVDETKLMNIDDLFGSANIEDFAEPINVDDIFDPQNSDKDIETINLDESIDSYEKDTKGSGKVNGFKESNIINDVISISSEDSQSSVPDLVIGKKEISDLNEFKPENGTDKTTKEPINVNKDLKCADLQLKDVIMSDFNITSEAKNKTMKSENDKLNVKQNNMIEPDSNILLKDIFNDHEITDEFGNNNCNKGLDALSKDVCICTKPNESGNTTNDNNKEITFVKIDKELTESKSDKVLCTFDLKENKPDESNMLLFKTEEPLNMISNIENSYVNDFGDTNNSEIDKVKAKNNKQHESNTKSEEDEDSDDCGYISSDFEFITEEEAKLDGLIINFNPNVHKKNVKLNRVKTIDISVNRFCNKYSESGTECVLMNLDNNKEFKQSDNVEEINLPTEDFANIIDNTRNAHDNVKEKRLTDILRSYRRKTYSNSISNRNLMQENLIVNNVQSNENQESIVEPNNFEENSQVTNAERNYLNAAEIFISPVKSNMKCHQPNILQAGLNQRNCVSEEIQRWRTFQRIRRDQFIPDQSYRNYHNVPTREENYQLFNPNFLPPPNLMRVENKSTLPSTMLVEYNGVGFDMRMMRGNDEYEDDEVKEEAAACAKRILEMYPEENRKRRRRF